MLFRSPHSQIDESDLDKAGIVFAKNIIVSRMDDILYLLRSGFVLLLNGKECGLRESTRLYGTKNEIGTVASLGLGNCVTAKEGARSNTFSFVTSESQQPQS